MVTAGSPATVLLLGADGFIGRHIAFALRREGWHVIASARRTARLDQMGFATLRADLTDPATHDPAFWRPHLAGVDHVINAAGLLNGSEAAFTAVHQLAPQALYLAMPDTCTALLISAIGIESAETSFASHRRVGEKIARDHGVTILRPGLVLGDTSHGGSSLLRAFAAFPLVTPVVGRGNQPFNPIHADDLATVIRDCLRNPPPPGPHAVGGPETLTLADMTRAYRGWLGLARAPLLRLPLPLARALGSVGDALRLGPISRTAVDQLSAGVLAPTSEALTTPVRPFSTFHRSRPAGTQDLWHARLYLLRPVLRLTLALLWIVSGLLGLFLPADQFLPLLGPTALPAAALIALARLGGLADLAIALALLRNWRPRLMAWLQVALVALYTLAFTILAPALWLLPLGGLLKNLPILALLLIHAVLEDER